MCSTTLFVTMADESKGATTAVEEREPLQAIQQQVDELYNVHDTVFTADKAEKQAQMKAMVDSIIAAVAAVEPANAAEKAALKYYHGKALDAMSQYSSEAEELLSAAVKLDPSRIDAWNSLGNCFWKKKDLQAAMNCFTGAAKQKPNAASLRQLSMLMRQMGDTPQERLANIKESVAKAKEAVAVDVTDPKSWYVLGNAYLSTFFSCDHKPEDLTAAMKAYARADAKGDSKNPDLHYNSANVLMFQEEYDMAVASYRKALSIDPSLPAQDAIDGLVRQVKRVANLVKRKAKTKAKKLKQLAASLPTEAIQKKVAESKDAEGRTFCKLSDLKEGPNPGKMLLLKMLISAIRTDNPPATLVMMDADQGTAALSLYHLTMSACDRFSHRDTFIVVDPIIKVVGLTAESGGGDGGVSYPCIQVLNPNTFYVNGRSVSGAFAHADLKISNFDQ